MICKEACDSLVCISLTSLDFKELKKLNSIEINITMYDCARIMLTQKGYQMHIKSTHYVVFCILQPNQEPIYLLIEEDSQQICLQAPSIKDGKGNLNKTFRWMQEDNGNQAPWGLKSQGLGMDPWM